MIYRTVTVEPDLSSGVIAETLSVPRLISVEPTLVRLVDAQATLTGSAVNAEPVLTDATVSAEAELLTSVRHYSTDVEYYSGEYEATPKTETSTQVFQTREKMMRRDFLVYTIPTREEYNAAGGVTFTIGGSDGG